MNEQDCEQIAELLVDFSDGELSAAEAARVEGHLGACAACRARLDRLERSLRMAREIWHESAAAAAGLAVSPTANRGRPIRWQLAVSASVAAAVLVGVVGWQIASHLDWGIEPSDPVRSIARLPEGLRPKETDIELLIAKGPEENRAIATGEAASGDALLAVIDRAGRRARLAASLELLWGEPALEPFARQAEGYLETAYGDLDWENPGPPRQSHHAEEDES